MSKEITPEMVKDAAHHSNWEQYKLVYRKELANIERQARISELEMLVKQNKFPCNTLELQQYLMNRTAELEREE